MTATPYKPTVHWGLDVSIPDFGSPVSTTSSENISTSSLQYINSQLVAHGFVPAPGLSLEGLASSDHERVIRCLLGMLGQRIEDMSRTEELSTKLRTLSYDYQRLVGMHKSAMEQAANAEREMNVFKSRLATAARALESTENAHKSTSAELQRTRTALQGLRQTHQADLKKREAQVERMQEKWSKLADMQAQVGRTASGIHCANVGVMEGEQALGRCKGFLDVALEHAEEARSRLDAENARLRKLALAAANELQSILYLVRSASGKSDEPPPITTTILFPLHPQNHASETVASLVTSLREAMQLALQRMTVCQMNGPAHVEPTTVVSSSEVERLQSVIEGLRSELDRAQKASQAAAAETRALFDKFTSEQMARSRKIGDSSVGDISVDFLTAPEKDEERSRLQALKYELDEERRNFTEAAVKLGKERAALEAERVKFLDEKRQWQVELMLAELPPTPKTSTVLPPRTSPSPKKVKSPRRSPAKGRSPKAVPVGKVGSVSGRKTRVSRRSLVGTSPPPPISRRGTVEMAYETEVVLPLPALPVTTSLLPLGSSLLPNSFVLPPPSPRASLPIQPAILPITSKDPEDNPSTHDQESSDTTNTSSDILPATQPGVPIPTNPSLITPPGPSTTFHRPFPMTKPMASRMIHAYSPAKPSPLSRILMLADSPLSDDSNDADPSGSPGQLGAVIEEDETTEEELFPKITTPYVSETITVKLGTEESSRDGDSLDVGMRSDRESPLVEKAISDANNPSQPAATTKSKVLHQPKRPDTDRGNFKTPHPSASQNFPRKTTDKENKSDGPVSRSAKTGITKSSNTATSGSNAVVKGKKVVASRPSLPANVTSKTAGGGKTTGGAHTTRMKPSTTRPPPLVKSGGARRVLIDSAEAPPLSKAWRG